MADLAITADQVTYIHGETIRGRLGATIAPAVPVYYDEGTDKYYAADANQTARSGAEVVGLTNGAGVNGREVSIQTDGVIDVGAAAAIVVGTTYVLSGAAGKICPIADQVSGDWVTWLGVGDINNQLKLKINASGIQKA